MPPARFYRNKTKQPALNPTGKKLIIVGSVFLFIIIVIIIIPIPSAIFQFFPPLPLVILFLGMILIIAGFRNQVCPYCKHPLKRERTSQGPFRFVSVSYCPNCHWHSEPELHETPMR